MTARIAVVCHDLESNALGRAIVLAELLAAADVRIVGFGHHVWPPAEHLPVIALRPPATTAMIPAAVRDLRRAVAQESVLISSKTRALSYGLTALVRGDRPHLLDIDDLEHAFVRRRFGWLRQLVEPDREPVTRLLEQMPAAVDGLTVASRALQRRFGGTWVPHIRDRRNYAALALRSGPGIREGLRLGKKFVIGFVGTPRAHKGLRTVAGALATLDDATMLLIAGAGHDDPEVQAVDALTGGRVRAIGAIPLGDVPGVLGACDVVLVPQQPSLASTYQSPAKLFDALAAGSAIVASDTGDAAEIVGSAGVLTTPGDPESLARAITDLRRDPARLARLRKAAADRYVAQFSLPAWQRTMEVLVDRAIERKRAKAA